MADKKITELTVLTTPTSDDIFPIVDSPGASPVTKKITYSNLFAPTNTIISGIQTTVSGIQSTLTTYQLIHSAEGRLTLTSATPVTVTDVTAATTLYYSEYSGNGIALYDGSQWNLRAFSNISISLSGKTANTNYDVFCYDNSGTPTLDILAWTNDTTRATALAYQNGVLVKSGAVTRRYLGTIRITSTTGQCEDSISKRFVWNMYNQVPRILRRLESTLSWTYQSINYRQWNGNTANQVEMVCGQPTKVSLSLLGTGGVSTGGVHAMLGFGEDSTSVKSSNCVSSNAGNFVGNAPLTAFYSTYLLGYHYLAMLESSNAGTPVTFYGNNDRGAIGELLG